MTLGDKLHKAGDAFFGSKDSHAEEKREAEAQRDREAEAKLAKLQESGTVGDSHNGGLSTVPPAGGAGYGHADLREVKPVEPEVDLRHRAENTALRPESQENMRGDGTAGEDLAI